MLYRYNPAINANNAVILIVVNGFREDIKTTIIGARKDENITIVTLYCLNKNEYKLNAIMFAMKVKSVTEQIKTSGLDMVVSPDHKQVSKLNVPPIMYEYIFTVISQ